MSDAFRHHLDHVAEAVADAVADAKPRLRGWLHLGTAPLTLAAGIVLIALSPTSTTRIGSAIFTTTAVVLFTVSAIYHRGTWSPGIWAFLRRFDHSNIFLLIAGSYTAFALLLLEGTQRTVLLWVVWSGAVAGVLFRVFWAGAPRWFYLPIYLALGWAAIFFLPGFLEGASRLGMGVGAATFTLILVGGALYTLGGVIYGFQRPDPWPQWFGFHEIFHTFTILAFATHYTGVFLATYSLR